MTFSKRSCLDAAFGPMDDGPHGRRGFKSHIDDISQQIFFLQIPALLNAPGVVRAGMPHHHRRRRVKPCYQHAAFLVYRQIKGPPGPFHALAAQPVFRRTQQCPEGFLIILGLQHSPETGVVLEVFKVKPIDLRADPSHGHAFPVGHPEATDCMFKIGIAGRKMHSPFKQQGRHPHGIIFIQRHGQANKGLATQAVFDFHDFNRSAGGQVLNHVCLILKVYVVSEAGVEGPSYRPALRGNGTP